MPDDARRERAKWGVEWWKDGERASALYATREEAVAVADRIKQSLIQGDRAAITTHPAVTDVRVYEVFVP